MPVKSPPSVEAVAAFVEKIHIFRGIGDKPLFDISDNLIDKRVNAGDVILEADAKATSFYIIYAGKFTVTRTKGQKTQTLSRGDYFGIDALLPNEERGSQITAASRALLLELPAEAITEISGALDYVRGRLKNFWTCREQARTTNFSWIEPDEVIYFVQNKHHFLFLQRLPIPALLVLQGPILTFLGMWLGAMVPLILSPIGFVVGLIWLLWNWVDWKNDFYIITNQRVIWVEKIVGIFDSRQEAHMREVTSVGVKTDVVMQSMFDYGHIDVSTIFGGIELMYVPCPQFAHVILEEQWQRTKEEEKQEDIDRLHDAIIAEIKSAQAVAQKKRPSNAPPPPPPPPPPPKTVKDYLPKPKLPRLKFQLFKKKPKKKRTSIFNLRFEEGREIIYRKHSVVLAQQAGVPALLGSSLLIMFLWQLYLYFFTESAFTFPISITIMIAVASLGAFGWMWYQYEDWQNDLFKVSNDKVFDIDRKPFGDVQSRSAPIEKIESLEYQRVGLLSVFFNFGTVYMHIGDEEFEFENVLDPAAVLQDINHRIKAIQESKKQAQAKKERDEVIKWLVAYHQSAEKISDMLAELEEAKKEANKGDSQGSE